MCGVLKFKLWFKILCLAATVFFVGFLLFALLSTGQEDEVVFFEILICSLLGATYFVFTILAFSFKITVGEEYLSVRKFLVIKTFKYDDITNIKYKKEIFGSFTYVIKFDKRRVEISQFLSNRNLIDKKLKLEGIFKKYPRFSELT